MDNQKKVKIYELTQSETWGIIKELFSEKRSALVSYSIEKLNTSNPDSLKEFETMRNDIKNFETFIVEIENIGKEIFSLQVSSEISDDIEEQLSGQ